MISACRLGLWLALAALLRVGQVVAEVHVPASSPPPDEAAAQPGCEVLPSPRVGAEGSRVDPGDQSIDLAYAEFSTGPDPDWTVIFLHGLGSNGHQYRALLPELTRGRPFQARFLLPDAPLRALTCENQAVTSAWYDILTRAADHRELDLASLHRSRLAVHHLMALQRERGVPAERLLLVGYSQGGALAYAAGLTYPEALGGIVVLSGYLPAPSWLLQNLTSASRSTPVFAAHGRYDEVVTPMLAAQARDQLEAEGYRIHWQLDPIGHDVTREQLRAVGQWLETRTQTALVQPTRSSDVH